MTLIVKRKSRKMAARFRGIRDGEDGDSEALMCSVRNNTIAFRCDGERLDWPHLSIEQAERLLLWLGEAIHEARQRS